MAAGDPGCMRAWLATSLLLLAGCVDDVAPDEPMPEAPAPGATWQTFYVDASGNLVVDEPDAGRVTLDWGYAQWLDGTAPPAWSGLPGPVRILEGNLTLWYEATRPSASGDVRPELTAWWGSDASIVHHVFIQGPDTVEAGQTIEATAALRIPVGGLVMGPERSMLLRIGTYYADGPQLDTMDVLVGNGTPSRLDLLVEPLDWPTDLAGETIVDETFAVTGGRCTVDANPEGSAEHRLTIDVDDATRGLQIRLQQASGEPTRDVDFSIKGPSGEDAGGGHGSFDIEGADVWWPNIDAIGPGTYTIHLYACTAQVGDLHLQVVRFT